MSFNLVNQSVSRVCLDVNGPGGRGVADWLTTLFGMLLFVSHEM